MAALISTFAGITAISTADTQEGNKIGPQLQFTCGVAKVAEIDPIVDPEHPHDHVFYGNKGVDANSTHQTLVENPATTCTSELISSSYWHPVIKDSSDGFQEIKAMNVYYRGWGDPAGIGSVPRGLQMITNKVDYRCTSEAGSVNQKTPPYRCTGGYAIRLFFPECWNEESRKPDSLAHRTAEGCPDSHPYRLPALRATINFRNTDGVLTSPLRVSAGAGKFEDASFMHGDVFEAFQPGFNGLVRDCIRKVKQDQPTPAECVL